MNYILATLGALTFTVGISIGAYSFTLSGDTKGNIKGDISYSVGNVSRGSEYPLNYKPNEMNEGIGAYKKVSLPVQPMSVDTKFYDNKKISSDLVITAKACNQSGFLCVKAAAKKRVYDNFDKKKEFNPSYRTFYFNSLKLNNKLSPTYIPPSPNIDKPLTLPPQVTKKTLNANYSVKVINNYNLNYLNRNSLDFSK